MLRIHTVLIAALIIAIPATVQSHVRDEQQSTAQETSWQTVDAGAFSISAPSGWAFHQLPGADSYVGEFFGDGIVLRFDFGAYSKDFKSQGKSVQLVVPRNINGLPARITSPKTPGRGVTGIYFLRTFGSNKLSLFGQDLSSSQQELVLRIFQTIRFSGTVPPVVPAPPKNEQ